MVLIAVFGVLAIIGGIAGAFYSYAIFDGMNHIITGGLLLILCGGLMILFDIVKSISSLDDTSDGSPVVTNGTVGACPAPTEQQEQQQQQQQQQQVCVTCNCSSTDSGQQLGYEQTSEDSSASSSSTGSKCFEAVPSAPPIGNKENDHPPSYDELFRSAT